MSDPYDLQRFVDAQDPVIDRVRGELERGRKTSHWMWFVFPQVIGLGRSAMAETFAIKSLAEAEAYLAHPILGPRLRQCTRLMNAVADRSISQILGYPDDLKFHACMTLFSRASPDEKEFEQALDKYFEGQPHGETLERL